MILKNEFSIIYLEILDGGTAVRIIDWNISYSGDIERKINYLQTLLTENTCVLLQEVKPHAYEHIKTTLSDRFNMLYSLDYRAPGRFDSNARKLGVLILASKDWKIVESGVIDRSLFPDRTMYATIQKDNELVKIVALHSLTGCDYHRSKSVQYDSFAEFINSYCPDIIGIDANEPQIDHYDIKQMQFFNNGPGAKHFFDEIVNIGLIDAFIHCYGIDNYVEGQPLATSHIVRRKGAVRYDFLFVKDTFQIDSFIYNYDDAITAGSDHALLLAEFLIK